MHQALEGDRSAQKAVVEAFYRADAQYNRSVLNYYRQVWADYFRVGLEQDRLHAGHFTAAQDLLHIAPGRMWSQELRQLTLDVAGALLQRALAGEAAAVAIMAEGDSPWPLFFQEALQVWYLGKAKPVPREPMAQFFVSLQRKDPTLSWLAALLQVKDDQHRPHLNDNRLYLKTLLFQDLNSSAEWKHVAALFFETVSGDAPSGVVRGMADHVRTLDLPQLLKNTVRMIRNRIGRDQNGLTGKQAVRLLQALGGGEGSMGLLQIYLDPQCPADVRTQAWRAIRENRAGPLFSAVEMQRQRQLLLGRIKASPSQRRLLLSQYQDLVLLEATQADRPPSQADLQEFYRVCPKYSVELRQLMLDRLRTYPEDQEQTENFLIYLLQTHSDAVLIQQLLHVISPRGWLALRQMVLEQSGPERFADIHSPRLIAFEQLLRNLDTLPSELTKANREAARQALLTAGDPLAPLFAQILLSLAFHYSSDPFPEVEKLAHELLRDHLLVAPDPQVLSHILTQRMFSRTTQQQLKAMQEKEFVGEIDLPLASGQVLSQVKVDFRSPKKRARDKAVAQAVVAESPQQLAVKRQAEIKRNFFQAALAWARAVSPKEGRALAESRQEEKELRSWIYAALPYIEASELEDLFMTALRTEGIVDPEETLFPTEAGQYRLLLADLRGQAPPLRKGDPREPLGGMPANAEEGHGFRLDRRQPEPGPEVKAGPKINPQGERRARSLAEETRRLTDGMRKLGRGAEGRSKEADEFLRRVRERMTDPPKPRGRK